MKVWLDDFERPLDGGGGLAGGVLKGQSCDSACEKAQQVAPASDVIPKQTGCSVVLKYP